MMEQVQWSTPNKNDLKWSNSPIKSPVCHKTPIKTSEVKHKQTAYQNNSGGFTVLPNHITPPSGFTKFVARNPFDANLTNKLHLSVISPTVFSKISSPKQDANFMWNVEELALIKPASIEEFPIQQLHCSDPEIEIKAQAAIDQFFTKNQIIPSPWSGERKHALRIEMSTPTTRPKEDLNSTRDSYNQKKSRKDGWTQTTMSLPPELPKELEEALKPYFTFTQEQHVENDEANLSNSSLRRKLFFNNDDGPENETSSMMSFSPERSRSSMVLCSNCSPTQSGIFEQGLLVKRNSQQLERTHGTPRANSNNLSPPNVSPISTDVSHMSCQSIRSRVSRSVARLDFTTDMSIETSMIGEKQIYRKQEQIDSLLSTQSTLGSSMLHADVNSSTEDIDNEVESNKSRKNVKENEISVMLIQEGENAISVECENNVDSKLLSNQHEELMSRVKFAAEWCKVHSDESYPQQNITCTGISGQQSTYNFNQDTGYQTHSMNSTNLTDNYNHVSPMENVHWEEKILLNDDELTDWKKNMKHLFSSTPSKNRDRDN